MRLTHRTCAAVLCAAIALGGVSALPATALADRDAPAAGSAATDLTTSDNKPTCAPDEVTPGVFRRAIYVWQRLRTAGYSTAAAAGVLGTLDFVSAISPTAIANDRSRFGLAQWPSPRWVEYVQYATQRGLNRWNLSTQTDYLLQEMGRSPGRFHNRAFQLTSSQRKATIYFSKRFTGTGQTRARLKQTRAVKAQLWLQTLARIPVRAVSDNRTYGLTVPCNPPNATLDKCPRVPQSFKDNFAAWTGLTWDRLSGNARAMSRCVYTNFPRLVVHGTYWGHMPDWQHAIDFMMPGGCRSTPVRHTTTRADLKLGTLLAHYLFVNRDRLGVDYLIWQDHIRNPGEHSDENDWVKVRRWRQDGYNNGDCTNTHFDHVHASVYS